MVSQEKEREEGQEEQVPPQFLRPWRRSDGREVREQNLPAQARPQLELVEQWVPEQKEPVASQEMEREVEQEEQVPPQFLHPWREERWEEVREQDLPAQVRPQLELVERWVLEQKQPEASQEMERGAEPERVLLPSPQTHGGSIDGRKFRGGIFLLSIF